MSTKRGRTILATLLTVGIFTAVGALAQERFVKPVDEVAKDPGFLVFRKKLIAAAERKDAKYILSIVDRNIKNGFGGEDGIANFKKNWKIERPDSEFWGEFLAVVKNGGKFDGTGKSRTSFSAPYTFTSWPEDLDAFEYWVIFGSDVNLRKTGAADGQIVGRLSYNVVKVDLGDRNADADPIVWVKVKTLGGLSGFVHRDFVRSPIGYRAGFNKVRGRWVMTYFLAGD